MQTGRGKTWDISSCVGRKRIDTQGGSTRQKMLMPFLVKWLFKNWRLERLKGSIIINEFRCYEAKVEESEKASSHRESNPGHLWNV